MNSEFSKLVSFTWEVMRNTHWKAFYFHFSQSPNLHIPNGFEATVKKYLHYALDSYQIENVHPQPEFLYDTLYSPHLYI